jgi:hypothetical protein
MRSIAEKVLKTWAIEQFNKLPSDIRCCIRVAINDLYHGPISTGEEFHGDEVYIYQGFSEACDIIRKALENVDVVWVDIQLEQVLENEPEWYSTIWRVIAPDGSTLSDEFETEEDADKWGYSDENTVDDWDTESYESLNYSEGDIYRFERRSVLVAITDKELVDYII